MTCEYITTKKFRSQDFSLLWSCSYMSEKLILTHTVLKWSRNVKPKCKGKCFAFTAFKAFVQAVPEYNGLSSYETWFRKLEKSFKTTSLWVLDSL